MIKKEPDEKYIAISNYEGEFGRLALTPLE
jgi:hypothetical protein